MPLQTWMMLSKVTRFAAPRHTRELRDRRAAAREWITISYEDSCGRIGERLGRIGAPRETLDHLHIWDDPPGLFSPASGVGGAEPSGGFSMLEAAIRDVGPSLVVIDLDPVSAMMGACTLNGSRTCPNRTPLPTQPYTFDTPTVHLYACKSFIFNETWCVQPQLQQ